MRKIHIIVCLIFLVLACSVEETHITPQAKSKRTQGEFFANLFELCGETFSDEATYPDDPVHELVGVNLIATIQTCTEEEIWMVLNIGGDLFRAWVISRTGDGLHLRHYHQNSDGTPHELTNYCGMATDEGTVTRQYFAADDITKEMLPKAETNIWSIMVNRGSELIILSIEECPV